MKILGILMRIVNREEIDEIEELLERDIELQLEYPGTLYLFDTIKLPTGVEIQ